VRLGIGILPHAGHLPGDLDVRRARPDLELIVFDLALCKAKFIFPLFAAVSLICRFWLLTGFGSRAGMTVLLEGKET
jgi:hypothetical protein